MKRGSALPAVAGAVVAPLCRFRRAAGLAVVLLLAGVLLVAAGGCGRDTSAGSPTELRVFAAASLKDAFSAVGDQYTAAHPDIKVTFNFAGSQELVMQLEQGASAEVLATADERTMRSVQALVDEPSLFAGNLLQIVVASGNPLGVAGLDDLARDDLKVVMAAPEVPVGKYAMEALEKAGVHVEPVSLEDNVKGVVTKVALGEADAGIVYMTDVQAAGGGVSGVSIPADQNVIAVYPIARVRGSSLQDAAQAFIDLVLSADGQRILQEAGFTKPGG